MPTIIVEHKLTGDIYLSVRRKGCYKLYPIGMDCSKTVTKSVFRRNYSKIEE